MSTYIVRPTLIYDYEVTVVTDKFQFTTKIKYLQLRSICTWRFFPRVRYYYRYQMCSFYCHKIKGEELGPSPILFVIHTITIGTIQNF